MDCKFFSNVALKEINNIYISPNEKYIVILETEGLLKIYEINKKKSMFEKGIILDVNNEYENISLIFSSDSKKICYYFKGSLHILNIFDMTRTTKKFDKIITSFCFSKDTNEIVTCFLNGKIDIYDYDFILKNTIKRNNYCDHMKYEKNILSIIDLKSLEIWNLKDLKIVKIIYFSNFSGNVIIKRPLIISENFNFISFKNNNFLYIIDVKNTKIIFFDIENCDFSILNFSNSGNFLLCRKINKISFCDLKKFNWIDISSNIIIDDYIGVFSQDENSVYLTNNTSKNIMCYDCSYLYRKEKQKIAFLLGMEKTSHSALFNFAQNDYCDHKNLSNIIFDYLPQM